jgi:hypothetical protein
VASTSPSRAREEWKWSPQRSRRGRYFFQRVDVHKCQDRYDHGRFAKWTRKRFIVAPFRPRANSVHLRQALGELARLDEQSREEGFPPPSAVAKAIAERIVTELLPRFPRGYDIYPTSEGEVAVEPASRPGRGVLIVCDPKGGVACYVTIDGKNRRARYDDASRLPDSFIAEAIRDLDRI